MRLLGGDQGSNIRLTPAGAKLNGKAELMEGSIDIGGNFENAGQYTSNGARLFVQKNLKNTDTGIMIINGSKTIENWASRHPWYFMLIGIALERLVSFLFLLFSTPKPSL